MAILFTYLIKKKNFPDLHMTHYRKRHIGFCGFEKQLSEKQPPCLPSLSRHLPQLWSDDVASE